MIIFERLWSGWENNDLAATFISSALKRGKLKEKNKHGEDYKRKRGEGREGGRGEKEGGRERERGGRWEGERERGN